MANELNDVFVATDSSEIETVIKNLGGKTILTKSSHETGTDRIAEASCHLDCDIVVNIQGDEALVNPEHINEVARAVKLDPGISCGILVCPFTKKNSPSDIKAVLSEQDNVLYFSRADIPSNSRANVEKMWKAYHIVPFRKKFLQTYASWTKGNLEKIEYNEYLRILEKGYSIRAIKVESDAVSVDTAHDLEEVRKKMQHDPFFSHYQHLRDTIHENRLS